MAKYILKRLVQMIPIMFIISIGIFGIVELMPGDPLTMYFGEAPRLSPEVLEQMRENLGVDKPVAERYFIWLRNLLKLDLGVSTQYKKPVVETMGLFIWNTFLLNIITTPIAFILSLFIGIRSAVKRRGFFDNFFTVFTLVFVSIPTFVFSLLLIYIFPIKLGILPITGMVKAGYAHANSFERAKDILYHMILPGSVLVCVNLARFTRYIRSSMLEVINQDYIRTARSKGLSEKVVIYKHALRNAMIPIVTLIGSSLGTIFTGAIMLETTVSWPGMGQIMAESIQRRDIPFMIAAFVFYALMTLLGNLFADIGYVFVDPQIKYD